jgi:hypothetical protein
MDGERAVLEGLVLPELRTRLRGEGIEIDVVDPARTAGEAWDLALRFQEIETCQIFIGLLGERYGEAPKAVPLSLVAAHPWLAEDPGRSVLELEILQGALREPGSRAGFFYLRNPQFPSMVPEELRARFLPENEEAVTRLASLKERIRSSGRPVFDGYPCGWSEGLSRASRLDTFAEQIFEDLWTAVQERIRATAAPATPEPAPAAAHVPLDKALPLHENVQFTIYRPKAVEPAKWYPLLAFAHLEELPADAPADEPDPTEEVLKQARRILGDLADGYTDVKQDSRQAVPHEAEITFLPEIPGFEVNPPRRTFLWLESVQREEFRIRAGPESEGQRVRGRLSVFWGSILLAEVSLTIRVDAWIAGAPLSPPERATSRPFRNIFPSYSHKDAFIVEEFERYARTLGDRYLRDVHELRAGEVWNDQLKNLIQQADVFQLFWSWNALRSRNVEEEWRYALSLGKPNFVRPTYWEDPLPEAPELRLPPGELRRLHFQLLPGGFDSKATSRGAETPQPAQATSPSAPSPGPDFDLNATVFAFPSAPSREPAASEMQFDETKAGTAELPPLPPIPPPPPPTAAEARPAAPPLAATASDSSPVRSSSRYGVRPGFVVATTIALAIIGLALFSSRNASLPTAGVAPPDSRPTASQQSLPPEPLPTQSSEPHPIPRSRPSTVSQGREPERPADPVSPGRSDPVPSSLPPSQQHVEPRNSDNGASTDPIVSVITPDSWERLVAACRLDDESAHEARLRALPGSPMVQVFASADASDAAKALARYSSRFGFLLPREVNGHALCTVVLGPFPTEEMAASTAAEIRMSGGTDAKVVRFPDFTK